MRGKVLAGVAAVVLLLLVSWYLWLKPGKLLLTLSTDATSMALSPDGATLAIGQSQGIILYDLNAGTSRHVAESEPLVYDNRLSWDASGRYLYWVQSFAPQHSVIFDTKASAVVGRLDGIWPKWASAPPADAPVFLEQKGALKTVDLGTGQVGQAVAAAPCYLLYVSTSQNRVICRNEEAITVNSLDSGSVTESIPDNTMYPTVSPDGNWLVVRRVVNERSVTDLVNLSDGSRRTVINKSFLESSWRTRNEVALDIMDDVDHIFLLDVTTGKYKETTVPALLAEKGNALRWSSNRSGLWLITLTVRAYSWATFHHYDLVQYDAGSGRFSETKLAGDATFIAWDDAHSRVCTVLGKNQVWAYRLKH